MCHVTHREPGGTGRPKQRETRQSRGFGAVLSAETNGESGFRACRLYKAPKRTPRERAGQRRTRRVITWLGL
jgi:hypothetical protein